jgi:hypothetical protein
MKLQLNKKKLKNLSKDNQLLPVDMTNQVGGGLPPTNPRGDCSYSATNCFSCLPQPEPEAPY